MHFFLQNQQLFIRGNKKRYLPYLWTLHSDTNIISSSGFVSSWATTNNIYSFIQSTVGIQPTIDTSDLLNGIAPIRFTNDYLISSLPVGMPTGSNPFTVSCLLKCRSSNGTGGDVNYSYIWGYGATSTNDSNNVALGNRVGGQKYWWFKGAGGTTNSEIKSEGTEICLMTISYDGSTAKLYKNNILIHSNAFIKNVLETTFTIGTWRCYTTERVADCSIWELTAWDKALSPNEIIYYTASINARYGLSLS